MSTKTTAVNMLILDHSSNDAEQTINILRNSGHAVRASRIDSEEELVDALDKQTWDLFVVKDNVKNINAEQCLKIINHHKLDIPFIMMTSDYSVHRTLDAMRLGMKDVVPDDNDEYFKLVIERELGSINDRRNRSQADNALLETSKRNELLLDSSRDAIAYITDGMHIYANHAYIELFGYDDAEDLECMPIMDLMATTEHDKFKTYLKNHSKGENSDDFSFTGLNANNSTFEGFLSLTDSKYDGEDCTQVYIKTAEASDEELEQKLREISVKDRLTNLYNQHYFTEQLDLALVKAETDEQLYAVLYIEIDHFDNIQDEHGITNSDRYLKDVSQWLIAELSSDHILARIGDNTFAVLIHIDNTEDATALASTLCKRFNEHLFEVAKQTITDSFSIGICPVLATTVDSDKVMSNAYFACSNVQSKGGNNVRLHDSSLDSLDSREDAQTAMDLQDAIDSGRMHILYEPIVKLHGKVQQIFHARIAVESETGVSNYIEDVYQIAHRSSTSLKLDNWLMTQSFKIFSEYRSDHSNCKLKIHLSAATLLDENLFTNILDLLSQNDLPENSVIFGFGEDDIADHLKRAIKIYKEMGQHNLESSLSDFGGTENSHSVIDAINCEGLSWVSLESSLFEKFTTDHKAQERVQELLAFAHDFDLITIAPGISDAGSLATIWPMNVHHIHGDYIGATSDTMAFDFSEAAF